MATPGSVNQALLESNYQNAGDVYLDTKTEGAFQVLVDQINANGAIFIAGGSALIFSDTIAGLSTNNVFGQLSELEAQIQAAVGGIVPPGTVTTAMIQNLAITTAKLADAAVTYAKLSADMKTAAVGGQMYAYRNLKGGF